MSLFTPAVTPLTLVGMKAVLFGDSIMAQNHGLMGDAFAISQEDTGSGATLAFAELGHPFEFNVAQNYGDNDPYTGRQGHNLGKSGNTTAQMVARLGDLTAKSADIVFVLGGTNDIKGNDASLNEITVNLDTITQAVLGMGAICVLYTILPRNAVDGSHDWTNNAEIEKLFAVNAWIRRYVETQADIGHKVLLVDAWDMWRDVTGDGYSAKAGYTKDSVHPSLLGAYYLKEATLATLAPFGLKDLTRGWVHNDDFDASSNPFGNHLKNLNGTGGATNDTTSGDVADHYRLDIVSGSALSVVASKVGAPNGWSDEWQRLEITSDGTGSGVEAVRFRPNPVGVTQTVANGWYVAQCQIDVAQSATEGLENGYYIKVDDRTNANDRDAYGGLVDSGDTPQPRVRKERTIRTVYWQAKNDGDEFRWELRIALHANVAGALTVDVGRCVLKRVNPPDFD